jgi:hypothetical protein
MLGLILIDASQLRDREYNKLLTFEKAHFPIVWKIEIAVDRGVDLALKSAFTRANLAIPNPYCRPR